LIPDVRVAFDLDVRLHEEAAEPGIVWATNWMSFIVKTKISDDLCVRGIGRKNFGPPA